MYFLRLDMITTKQEKNYEKLSNTGRVNNKRNGTL